MSSRVMGDAALAAALGKLETSDILVIDFARQDGLSPSFADQFVGGLAASLGFQEFRRRVKIRNASDTAAALLRHVILRKATARTTEV